MKTLDHQALYGHEDALDRTPYSWRCGPNMCNFGLIEVLAPVIISALAEAGVGAATASIIGTAAAGAIVGAGSGAAISAITGGDPGQGAWMGALTMGVGSGVGAAFPETAAALGLTAYDSAGYAMGSGAGAATATLDSAGNWVPAAGGFPELGAASPGVFGSGASLAGSSFAEMGADGNWIPGSQGFSDSVLGTTPGAAVVDAAGNWVPGAQGFPEGGAALAGSPETAMPYVAANDVIMDDTGVAANQGGGQGGGALGKNAADVNGGKSTKVSNTVKAAGALLQMVNALQRSNQPAQQQPQPGTQPRPSLAPPGGLFNSPLPPNNAFENRAPVQDYSPVGSWYTYGQHGSQPQFFSKNKLSFGMQPMLDANGKPILNLAKGGALRARAAQARTFDSGAGDQYVEGDDGGQDDTVNARLSPGEWVADAAFVSAVGDGNSKAGAKRLYEMRERVMREKGARVTPPKLKKPLERYAGVGR